MKRVSMLLALLPLIGVQATQAIAAPRGAAPQQQEEFPQTPLDDPYMPPAGDPDIFAPEDGPGEEPSPLNPADD
jgi:hypothetical protein